MRRVRLVTERARWPCDGGLDEKFAGGRAASGVDHGDLVTRKLCCGCRLSAKSGGYQNSETGKKGSALLIKAHVKLRARGQLTARKTSDFIYPVKTLASHFWQRSC
jgi:hypothetical protein